MAVKRKINYILVLISFSILTLPVSPALASDTTKITAYGMLSLVPPLLAILLAIFFRQVILALLAGIYSGALIIYGYNPLRAFTRMMDRIILESVSDKDHCTVIIFTMLLGGMVGIIIRTGGMRGIGNELVKLAKTRFLGQIATWLAGLLVFFDDYTSTLIVGNTLRPVTDKLKISREKLAYVVDCTSAPIASIAIISTWIGIEVSLIGDSLNSLGLNYNPYQIFLVTIPYRFYPIFSLMLVFIIASSGRDLGPMLKAERRAYRTGKVLADNAEPISSFDTPNFKPVENKPHRWFNAVIPIGALLIVTFISIWFDGKSALVKNGNAIGSMSVFELWGRGNFFKSLGSIFGNANSYNALLYASTAGVITAGILALSQKLLKLGETLSAMLNGMRSMLIAIVILILAWCIKIVCDDLETAGYIVNLTSGIISPFMLPTIIFLTACFISFSTGTSYGTMGILMPLAIPLAVEIGQVHGLSDPEAYRLLICATSGVLSGAIFGDHCSPISDTTILSSMASSCDHVDHVRTQLPYALIVAAVGIVIGDIPTAFGMSPWIAIVAAVPIFYAILYFFGKKVISD